MHRYYVNRNPSPDGVHEVHRADCPFVPFVRQELGLHRHCATAVETAQRHYPHSRGCFWCSKACHAGAQAGDVAGTRTRRRLGPRRLPAANG